MADLSAPIEPTATATSSSPLQPTPAHGWSPTPLTMDAEAMLGYESAHPWALGEAASERTDVRC